MKNRDILLEDGRLAWWDGTCNKCGSPVYELPSQEMDYVNWCCNKLCEHNVEHHVGDMEMLKYYTHK
jgi:hypothetical protein